MEVKIAIETINGLEAAKAQIDKEIQELMVKRDGFDSSISWFRQFLETHKADELRQFGEAVTKAKSSHQSTEVSVYQDFETYMFPIKADRRTQIVWTMKEIGRFVKLKYLGDEVKDNLNAHELKSETFLRTPVNAMLEDGTLVSVRYNGNWKKVFYGLPEWIGVDGGGHKYIIEEHQPLKDEIGYGYDLIEFEYEPRKFNRGKQTEEDEEEEADEDDSYQTAEALIDKKLQSYRASVVSRSQLGLLE